MIKHVAAQRIVYQRDDRKRPQAQDGPKNPRKGKKNGLGYADGSTAFDELTDAFPALS
jgi:hypothetical protein